MMKVKSQESGVGATDLLGPDLVFSLNSRVTTIGTVVDDTGRTGSGPTLSNDSIALSTLHAEERQLLALADGRRSVDELIQLSGMSVDIAHKHLRSLRDRGILFQAVSPIPHDDASGPPRPEDTESEGEGAEGEGSDGPDGSSALTRAIDEYLELAASALTSAAEDTSQVPGAAIDATTTLPGLFPGPATAGAPADVGTGASAGASASAGSPETALTNETSSGKVALDPTSPNASQRPTTFRPNVTAFWIPSLGDLLPNAQPAIKDAGSPSADAAPEARTSGNSSGPTVIVTGSPAAAASPGATGAQRDGSPPLTTVEPTRDGGENPSAAHAFTSVPAPFRVGNYEVATRIAQGGMGSIYVCRRSGASGFQQLFTLKVVRQHSAQREEAVQSFKREAHVGSLLSHTNLQTVLDVGSYKNQPFLVLDYVEGTSLSELISDDRRAPVPLVVAILLDVLRGLHHAHQLVDDKGTRLGLVHGDVSPQNVLVGVDGGSRLTDFGSATFTGEGRLHDPKWKAHGKPAYMAPEQLRAEPLDARTDVFAVGVLMWSALTAQKLFAGDTYDETIIKVLRKKIVAPSAFGAPACFDELCLKALSRSREGRYASADEMARELLRIASAENLLASSTDVGQWVRRESGEALGEQRRRIQLMFGSNRVAS
ncbi:MAG: protein kinase, partial [Deltaproteobacteria bacterium]|nr:protein kinase [Deltaproteobacteria bacterium]